MNFDSMNRRDFLRVVGFTAAAAASGLPMVAFGDEAVDGGNLHISLPASPKYFDPILYTGSYEGQIIGAVCDTLVQYKMDLSELAPSLATEWSASDDGMVYTFKLRDDVHFQPGKYQDGRLMTAEDVAYSLNRSAHESSLNRLGMLDHCDVTGDFEVECTLTMPAASFMTALTDAGNVIIPKEEVEGWGDEFGNHLVGTGPFIMDHFAQDAEVGLVRHEGFWGERPHLDGVTFMVVTDHNQAANGLETGVIDIATGISGEAVEVVRQSSACDLQQIPALHFAYAYMNQVNGPTADQRVRKAILMSLDREQIVAGVYQYGEAQVHSVPLPKGSWGYRESVEQLVPAYDPAGAKALLAEAGYADGLTLSFYITNSPSGLRFATIMQAMLKANANIDLDIHTADWGTFSADAASGNADIYAMSWTWYPDPYFFLNKIFHSSEIGALGNGAGFNHPEVDELLDKALAVTDQDERAQLYGDALEAIVSYDPMFVYCSTNVNTGIRPCVGGYTDRPDQKICIVNNERNVWKSE